MPVDNDAIGKYCSKQEEAIGKEDATGNHDVDAPAAPLYRRSQEFSQQQWDRIPMRRTTFDLPLANSFTLKRNDLPFPRGFV